MIAAGNTGLWVLSQILKKMAGKIERQQDKYSSRSKTSAQENNY